MLTRLALPAVPVTIVTLLLLLSSPLAAQSDVDPAIRFFLAGGGYCFRVAPEGVSMSEETEWTMLLLTSSENRRNEFKIRTIDPGPTRLGGEALTAVGESVTSLWRRESLRREFFERFAAAIKGGLLRAKVVKVVPPRLAQLKPTDRAELYLDYADRGTRVDFSRGRDLTAEQFLEFESHNPD